jgi:hypothetical protein
MKRLIDHIIIWLGGHPGVYVRHLERVISYERQRIDELEAIARECGETERKQSEKIETLARMVDRYRLIVSERADFRDVFPLPNTLLRVYADNEYRLDLNAKVYSIRLQFPETLCMNMMLDDLADANTREWLYVWSERFANQVRDKAREIAIKALNALPNVPTGFFK